MADAGHSNHDASVSSDGSDRGVDVGTVVGGEVVETGLDAGDESANGPDLVFGGHGFGACPFVDVGGGEDSFPVAEQVVEVGVEVG